LSPRRTRACSSSPRPRSALARWRCRWCVCGRTAARWRGRRSSSARSGWRARAAAGTSRGSRSRWPAATCPPAGSRRRSRACSWPCRRSCCATHSAKRWTSWSASTRLRPPLLPPPTPLRQRGARDERRLHRNGTEGGRHTSGACIGGRGAAPQERHGQSEGDERHHKNGTEGGREMSGAPAPAEEDGVRCGSEGGKGYGRDDIFFKYHEVLLPSAPGAVRSHNFGLHLRRQSQKQLPRCFTPGAVFG
ncbi:hypothetical protein BAE44_0018106, partial [Dichanthelium oligosanthes]